MRYFKEAHVSQKQPSIEDYKKSYTEGVELCVRVKGRSDHLFVYTDIPNKTIYNERLKEVTHVTMIVSERNNYNFPSTFKRHYAGLQVMHNTLPYHVFVNLPVWKLKRLIKENGGISDVTQIKL